MGIALTEAEADREPLPLIDEPAIEIEADRERIWVALLGSLPGSRRGDGQLAALLGCEQRRQSGDPGVAGSTIVGFRVARATRPAELSLAGRHRFSRYALTYRIDPISEHRSRLRAASEAAFPGALGRGYRALVIGSGAHARLMRKTLAAIKRRAEAIPS